MARSMSSTGTTRTSAAPTSCTTRPGASSGLRRSRHWPSSGPAAIRTCARCRDTELVALQTSRSDWHARRARVILQGRAAKGTLTAQARADLMTMFQTVENPDWRLRAMWALHVTGGWTSEALEKALADRDEYIRAWAIQLLTEDGTPSAEAIARFARNGARRTLGGRAPLPGGGAAAPRSRERDGRSPLACSRTVKMPQIRTCRTCCGWASSRSCPRMQRSRWSVPDRATSPSSRNMPRVAP